MCNATRGDSRVFLLTVSTHEVGEEGIPGLAGWEDRVVVGEMIEGHRGVFGVPEDHQDLHDT